MKLIGKGVTFLGALCVLTGTAQAADGLLLVQKTTSGTTSTTNQVRIERTRLRAESTGSVVGERIMIFDGTKQVMTSIDPQKKVYSEITEADIERMAAQVAPAMAQLQQMMANMTPEQRAKMEAVRGRLGGATGAIAPPVKTAYKKVGTDTVGKWKCDKYDGFKGTEKVSEVCTVDPAVLGFAPADFEVSKQMAAFFKKMIPQMAEQMAKEAFTVGTIEEQGFSGVPVRQITTIAGRQTVTEITEASRQNFPDAVFQVPAGFQKTDMFGALGRGRGRQ